jgi:hemolysin III
LAITAQGREEELVNSITHGLGLVLSIAGISALAALASSIGTARYEVGCGVYGASLVVLYAASTLFHIWPAGEVKQVLLLLDHIGIYILIAGTYTPMALFTSRGLFSWSCLTAAWGFALVGSCAKVIRIGRLDEDSLMPYFVMSALCLMSTLRLLAIAPQGEPMWLLAGGLFYFAGLIFYFNGDKPFYHSIWHLFVLAGSICHYRAVLGYVITASL